MKKGENNEWSITTIEKELFTKLYQTKESKERVHLVLEDLADKDLMKGYGLLWKNLHSVPVSATLYEEDSLLNKPLCFPIWGSQRIQVLRGHQCLILDCALCSEKNIWDILYEWYNKVLRSAREKERFILADGSVKYLQARLKGLVILGARNTGKTKFFQSLCGFCPKRIIHVKNKFHKVQWQNIETAWLILIDDFSYDENKDLEIFKALLAGENTIIDGKWLSFDYLGGLPCVIVCNSSKMYEYFQTSIWFKDQCYFLDLQGFHLGPKELNNEVHKDISVMKPSDEVVSKRSCPFDDEDIASFI